MSAILREGVRIFLRNLEVKSKGFKRYDGDDTDICRSIIDSCYDMKKGYFMASSGNYMLFYSRDFGWCAQALLNLGYTKEVDSTLRYALERYNEKGSICTAINDSGRPFNFPNRYSPDSVAYLYRSLRIAKSKKLISQYSKFLNRQLKIFEDEVLNSDGTLRKEYFSGMRDHIKGKQLCHDMIMACMLCDEVDRINMMMKKNMIHNVLKKYDLKKILLDKYWNGTYFIDNLEDKYCSGHANTYSYYLEIISDRKMLRSSIENMKKNHLDRPMPLKYGYSEKTSFIWQEIFAKDWEKNTSWAMLGLAYIDVVSKVDIQAARRYLGQYKDSIDRYGCFIEVYSDGKPYMSPFFSSDDSMLWASMYLDLKRRLKT